LECTAASRRNQAMLRANLRSRQQARRFWRFRPGTTMLYSRPWHDRRSCPTRWCSPGRSREVGARPTRSRHC